jgi:hypothetical protein
MEQLRLARAGDPHGIEMRAQIGSRQPHPAGSVPRLADIVDARGLFRVAIGAQILGI